MKLSSTFACLVSSLLLSYSAPSLADDIDIYSGGGSVGTPNIMIVIDNPSSSNAEVGPCKYYDGTTPSGTSKRMGNQQCALANLAKSLPKKSDGTALINLGITLLAGVTVDLIPIDDNVFGKSATGGVTIPSGTTNREAFILAVKNLATTTGSAGQGAEMQEAWAYFTGGNGSSGGIDTAKGILSNKIYAGTNARIGCQRNYVIFLSGVKAGSSKAQDLNEQPSLLAAIDNAVAAGTITAAQGTTLKTTIAGKAETAGFAEEWARFMYNFDSNKNSTGLQNIVSYSIGIGDTAVPPAAPTNSMEKYIRDIALYGGGDYFAVGNDISALQNSLLKIFNEVQAVNSVFASASLPVSVSAQGSFQNQIFLGMFRPDPSAKPRWLGNLKQYQFIFDSATQSLQLAGANGVPVLSKAGTGFITPDARSFWTTANSGTSADSNGFYVKDPTGAGLAFDLPDGDLVEKGGAAQRLRNNNLTSGYTSSSALTRNLYTYCLATSACIADLTAPVNSFNSTNATLMSFTNPPRLPAPVSTDLVDWVRGKDNKGDEKGPGGTVTVRPSIHGDVVHSRPVVINYGDARGTVVFYGANDGVFHAVNGSATDVNGGNELWGFIPSEFISSALNRLRENSPQLLLPSTPTGITPTPLPKDYFVDGSTGVYQSLKADGTVNKAYLYITMRRGGRFMYAMDVSVPSAPKILWKKSNADAGFSELGQTWSRPKVAAVSGYTNPVLIFGAGYDGAEDIDGTSRPTDTMGRGIYVLDAITGALVWSATSGPGNTNCTGKSPTVCKVAGMDHSIPSEITLLDRNRDGKIERLYAADIAGNVWRVDLEPPAGNAPDKWQVTQLAALGTGSNRKFFFPPDVVPTGAAGAAGSFDAVLLGSGDREHPLYASNSRSTINRFYMVKDTKTGNDGSGGAVVAESGLFNATATAYDNSLSGYYVTLGAGEKVVNASTTIAGVTYFGTNQPTPPSDVQCVGNLGIARGYQLATFTGSATFTKFDGGGLPPSPVGGLVNIMVNGKNQLTPFLIGGGGTGVGNAPSSLAPINPLLNVKRKRSRTYWYNERD